jgi:hypothetical protein
MALLRSVDLMSLWLRLCLKPCATVPHVVYNSNPTAVRPLGPRTALLAEFDSARHGALAENVALSALCSACSLAVCLLLFW